MGLSRNELETIINFNQGEDVAYIFTYSRRWQKHLEKLGFQAVGTNDFGGRDYEIPKPYIKLPRGPKRLSDAQRDRLRERFKKITTPQGKNELRKENKGTRQAQFLAKDNGHQ